MKIIHITDSHGSMKAPEGRKDVYYVTFLKKLYELGIIIKREKINAVIHTGDLFHTARVADKLAGLTAEIIRSWGVPVYVVPGNHDIEGYSMATIEHTKLGLLAKAGVVKILDRLSPVTVDCNDFTVAISGQEYYPNIDEGNPDDFMMQQDAADFNILCYHGLLTDHAMPMKHTLASSINTDADVILCGHLHTSFTTSVGDTDVYNPGSMMRIERTDYNKKHIPQYGILEVSTDASGDILYSYDIKKFRCAQPGNVVFDFESKQLAEQKEITLDNFRASLQASANGTNTNNSQTLYSTLVQMGANDQETLAEAEKLYADAVASAPDKFEFKNGYVANGVMKYITKVTLENFQSHEYTELEFDNGLNVILGESNNGKTAILRALLWAIDNQPLGTDFIMTGKDICSVKIEYSDGSYIIRSRSRKGDSGTYDVHVFNAESNTWEDNTYKGFTNAVPVEIDNVHQMPKVAITKDIETHLNLMSQLEGPFLITASPQNKAAAIGRLTGTHIADLAISKASAEIKQISAAIKKSEDIRKQTEYELKQLLSLETLRKAAKHINLITNRVKELKALIDAVQAIDAEIWKTTAALSIKEQLYKTAKTVLRLKSLDNKLSTLYQHINTINTCMLSVLDNDKEIGIKQQKLCDANTVISLKEVVADAVTRTYEVKQIKQVYDEAILKEDDISFYSADLNVYRKFSKAGKIFYDSVTAKCAAIRSLNDVVEKKTEIETKMDNYSNALGENEGKVQIYKQQAGEIAHKMTQALLDNGVCPCCGQQLHNEDEANRVKEYIVGGK